MGRSPHVKIERSLSRSLSLCFLLSSFQSRTRHPQSDLLINHVKIADQLLQLCNRQIGSETETEREEDESFSWMMKIGNELIGIDT